MKYFRELLAVSERELEGITMAELRYVVGWEGEDHLSSNLHQSSTGGEGREGEKGI